MTSPSTPQKEMKNKKKKKTISSCRDETNSGFSTESKSHKQFTPEPRDPAEINISNKLNWLFNENPRRVEKTFFFSLFNEIIGFLLENCQVQMTSGERGSRVIIGTRKVLSHEPRHGVT